MSFDLNDLSPEDIIELAAELYEEGMEKEASEDDLPYGFDLNDLSPGEFLEFADAVADEMDGFEKEAMPAWAKKAWKGAKGMPAKVKKHYKGRQASAKARGATWGPHDKNKAPGKFRRGAKKAAGYAREYAPEGAAAAAVGGGGLAVRRRRKKNR